MEANAAGRPSEAGTPVFAQQDNGTMEMGKGTGNEMGPHLWAIRKVGKCRKGV